MSIARLTGLWVEKWPDMSGIRQAIDRRLSRAKTIEPFVRAIVGGGLLLVAGLWIASLGGTGGSLWLSGGSLALVGLASLAWGIWSQLELPSL